MYQHVTVSKEGPTLAIGLQRIQIAQQLAWAIAICDGSVFEHIRWRQVSLYTIQHVVQ